MSLTPRDKSITFADDIGDELTNVVVICEGTKDSNISANFTNDGGAWRMIVAPGS
jgi:hypothetical protein